MANERVGNAWQSIVGGSERVDSEWKRLVAGWERNAANTAWVRLVFGGGMYLLEGSGSSSPTPAGNLWMINPENPSDVSGGFGLVGAMTTRTGLVRCATFYNGELIAGVATSRGAVLEWYRINKDDPDDASGNYGRITTASGLISAESSVDMCTVGNYVYVSGQNSTYSSSRNIRRFDPANGYVSSNTGRTTRTFQDRNRQGIGPIAAYNSDILGIHTGDSSLYRINPTDPDSTAGNYGRIGRLPISSPNVRNALTATYDPAKGLYVLYTNRVIWLINPENPSDLSGDYGLVGSIPSTLTRPRALVITA